MNNNFKLFALFSLITFSSASSYSMLRRAQPQIGTTALMALRHCASATPKPEATETPKAEPKEFKYCDARMHPEDMAELKATINSNGFSWMGVASACLTGSAVALYIQRKFDKIACS